MDLFFYCTLLVLYKTATVHAFDDFNKMPLTPLETDECVNQPCLRKCCRFGEIYLDKNCVKSESPSPETITVKLFLDKYTSNEYTLRTIKTVTYGVPCNDTRGPNQAYQADNFNLYTDGRLLIINNNQKKIGSNYFVDFKNYCVDFTDSMENLSAIYCYKKDNFQLSRYLYYSGFCFFVSIPFLVMTIMVLLVIESFLTKLPRKITICQLLALTMSFILLADIRYSWLTKKKYFCISFGYLAQFSLLVNFFWLNVMCFDILMVFSGVSIQSRNFTVAEQRRKFLKYALYAWGMPLVICLATLACEMLPRNSPYKPNVGVDYCLLKPGIPRYLYYFLPLTIILVLNTAFFAITAYKIYKHNKEMSIFKADNNNVNNSMEKERLHLYFKLFLVMGITWVTEPVSGYFDEKPEYLWTIFDSINLLQGIPIFIIFVCKRRNIAAVKSKMSSSVEYFTSKRESFNVTSGTRSSKSTSVSSSARGSSGRIREEEREMIQIDPSASRNSRS